MIRTGTEYDLNIPAAKTMVILALQQHLMQACEALVPTSIQQPSPIPLDVNEGDFRNLLNKYFISEVYVNKIRNILRNQFHSINDEVLLQFAYRLADLKVYDRLTGIRSARIENPILVEREEILDYAEFEGAEPELLTRILEQVTVIELLMENCKTKDHLNEFLLVESVRIAALKKTYSNIAKLLIILIEGRQVEHRKPFNTDEIKKIREIGNDNAHEILEFPEAGGEVARVTDEDIYKHSYLYKNFISNFKVTIVKILNDIDPDAT